MSPVIQFKALIPREFSLNDLRGEMGREMNAIGDVMKSDFKSSTSTWSPKHKPTFKKEATQNPAYLRVEVFTTSKVYGYVSEGTRPHDISGKKSKRKLLRFRSGYLPKTVPGMLPARGGGPRGDFVIARKVHHPGSKGRKFPDLIVKVRSKEFVRRMQAAVNRGLKTE